MPLYIYIYIKWLLNYILKDRDQSCMIDKDWCVTEMIILLYTIK